MTDHDPDSAPWRIVLIEDQALFRNVLAKAIALHPPFELVGDSATGEAGKALCLELHPDLLVTDIDLPDADGIDLAEQLLRELPGIRTLALSNLKDPFTLNRVQEAGLHGYVEKDQPLDILEEAMETVAAGETYFTAIIAENSRSLAGDPDAFSKILSKREQEIVCLVAQGLTSSAIAERVDLSKRSVETYRYRIMKKLEIENVAALVDYAYQHGFVRRP